MERWMSYPHDQLHAAPEHGMAIAGRIMNYLVADPARLCVGIAHSGGLALPFTALFHR
jgi:hypothetical protein